MSDIINAENFTNSYLKVPTSQGYINFDEFRQKVEAVSDQNQKQQYILQRPTYVSPAKIARERKALNKINQIESETILSDVTNTFINLLAQNKIILSSTSEILSAKSDLLSRVTKEIQEKINHAVEGEDKRLTDGQISQDLSELLEDIYSEYDRNKTKIEFYNKFFRPAYLKSNQELCNKVPSNLVGLLRIDFDMAQPTENQIDIKFAEKFHQGGHYVPSEMCKPKFRVAIVIPYRDRYEHLMYFLWYLHPILQRQDIEYKIYVINQLGTTPFNRAQLLNIGFVESLKDYKYWDCFIFHDVDLVPENDHMLYHCPILPRHMSVAVDKFRYQLPYSTIFGGATAFTKSQFLTLNGYSNKFSGWGGEDDDMFRRLYLAQIDIQRPDGKIGRYRMIRHKKDDTNKANPDRFKLLKSVKSRWKMDGLNNLMETYRRISVDEHYSFTIINIQVIG